MPKNHSLDGFSASFLVFSDGFEPPACRLEVPNVVSSSVCRGKLCGGTAYFCFAASFIMHVFPQCGHFSMIDVIVWEPIISDFFGTKISPHFGHWKAL
jgi:hypothetical protein